MAYDEGLAERIREVLNMSGSVEKKVIGGIGLIVQGNMACGVYKQDLIVRIDPANFSAALKKKHVRVFDITGRPSKGWLLVGSEGVASDKDLKYWVNQSLNYALSLPVK